MEPALKQRLVGASVIIALAVIFIPMIFDDTNRNQNQSISIEIPKEPTDLQQRVISIDENSSGEQTQKSDESQNSQQAAVVDVIETQETIIDVVDNTKPAKEQVVEQPPKVKPTKPKVEKPHASKPPKPAVTTKPAETVTETHPQPPTSDKNATYRLKYGVFSQEKNAQKLKAQLIHNGLKALVEKQAATGMYRVFSNQYVSKTSVEKIQKQIAKLNLNIGKTSIEKLNQEGMDDAEMVLDTGWIVQIGVYSSKANSVKLRDKIRKNGFTCFVDEFKNNKNKNMYRVRIGPFAERSQAESSKKAIKTQMDLQGLIKPHEKLKVIN